MATIARERAKGLLFRFITKDQAKSYCANRVFYQKDAKGRRWAFHNRPHYPVECEGEHICIDAARGAPLEDMLLQVWLEVIGGRDDAICSRVKRDSPRLTFTPESTGRMRFSGVRYADVMLEVLAPDEEMFRAIERVMSSQSGETLAAICTTSGETIFRFRCYITRVDYRGMDRLSPLSAEIQLRTIGEVESPELSHDLDGYQGAYLFQALEFSTLIVSWSIEEHVQFPTFRYDWE